MGAASASGEQQGKIYEESVAREATAAGDSRRAAVRMPATAPLSARSP